MPESETGPISSPKPETPTSVRIGMRLGEAVLAKEPIVRGMENYDKIPPDKKILIATTHLSDSDLQIGARPFARSRELSFSTHSANYDTPWWRIIRAVGGEDSFMRVGVNRAPGSSDEARMKDRYELNPDDFDDMVTKIKKGKTPAVVAHRPTYDWKLPDTPAIGTVLLAHLSEHRTVLPVAVSYGTESPVNISHKPRDILKRLATFDRPQPTVGIAEAIELDPIASEDLQLAMRVLKSSERAGMSQDEKKKARAVLHKLRDQGGLIMESLAAQLPEANRGAWGKSSDQAPKEEK